MARARRSFKLRLSAAGLDVLIDSHCHLIRITRSLIAWGTTLHVAVEHLDTLPTAEIVDKLRALELGCLGGGRSEEHTAELQSLMRISYAVCCLQKKKSKPTHKYKKLV